MKNIFCLHNKQKSVLKIENVILQKKIQNIFNNKSFLYIYEGDDTVHWDFVPIFF